MKKITETSNLEPFYSYRFMTIDGKELYFTSLAGAFSVFSPEEIGWTLKTLQHKNLVIGRIYCSPKCSIQKIVIYRLKQQAK